MEPQEQGQQQSSSNERRSIRDLRISRPQPQQRTEKQHQNLQPQRPPKTVQTEDMVTQSQRRDFSKMLIPAGIAVFIALLLFVLLPIIFPDATVRVTPKSSDGLPKTTLIASFDPNADLSYSITSWSDERTKELPATKTVTVTEKASGKIQISNANTIQQRLIKNTRFETTSGKVYRIRDSVVVPAGKKAGASVTPGTLDVTVYADEGGDSFNIADASFTLPGLKDSDLFTKVTAKTVTAIAGGFSGEKKTADESTVEAARAELRKQLETGKAAPEGTLTGLIPLSATEKVSFESLPERNEGDSVILTEKSSHQVLTVPERKFAFALAKEAGSHIESTDVHVKNITDLSIHVADVALEAALAKKEIQITVDGTPKLVWNIDTAQLQKDLAGASREEVTGIQKRYSNIEKAVTTIRPFWKNTLPSNFERIEVIVETSEATE